MNTVINVTSKNYNEHHLSHLCVGDFFRIDGSDSLFIKLRDYDTYSEVLNLTQGSILERDPNMIVIFCRQVDIALKD